MSVHGWRARSSQRADARRRTPRSEAGVLSALFFFPRLGGTEVLCRVANEKETKVFSAARHRRERWPRASRLLFQGLRLALKGSPDVGEKCQVNCSCRKRRHRRKSQRVCLLFFFLSLIFAKKGDTKQQQPACSLPFCSHRESG